MTQFRHRMNKGFTLAELLIVIAIIAGLVAIAIPVFNKNLESAREAYDIHTMRQAASAAINLFYAGVTDAASADAAGLLWNDGKIDDRNAYGVYDPSTGTFLKRKSGDGKNKPYGQGTAKDGGTRYTLGNSRGAYIATEDYTNAIVMIAIYPQGNNKHIDIYWKNCRGDNKSQYVGGPPRSNDPNYSIRISLE